MQGADFLPLSYDEFKGDTKDPEATSLDIFTSHVLFILHSSFFIPHSTLSSSSSTQAWELYCIHASLQIDATGDISSLFWLQCTNFGHNKCHKIKHRLYKWHDIFLSSKDWLKILCENSDRYFLRQMEPLLKYSEILSPRLSENFPCSIYIFNND